MTFEDAYFKQKVLKHDSLEPFGFITSEKGYELRKPLMAEGLEARLFIDLEGKLTGPIVRDFPDIVRARVYDAWGTQIPVLSTAVPIGNALFILICSGASEKIGQFSAIIGEIFVGSVRPTNLDAGQQEHLRVQTVCAGVKCAGVKWTTVIRNLYLFDHGANIRVDKVIERAVQPRVDI